MDGLRLILLQGASPPPALPDPPRFMKGWGPQQSLMALHIVFGNKLLAAPILLEANVGGLPSWHLLECNHCFLRGLLAEAKRPARKQQNVQEKFNVAQGGRTVAVRPPGGPDFQSLTNIFSGSTKLCSKNIFYII